MRPSRKFVTGLLGAAILSGAPASSQHNGRFEPRPPERVPILAHYVNWHQKNDFMNTWGLANTVPIRRNETAGFGYDSLDRAVLTEQNREMILQGIIPLVSWWGPDSRAGDAFLDAYLTLPGPRLGLLYEVTGRLYEDPLGHFDVEDPRNVQRFLDDMQHLHDRYWSRPEFGERWFRIDDKPVLYIWLSHAFRGSFERLRAAVRERSPLFIIGSDFNIDSHFRPGLQDVVRGLDAVSAYGIYHPDLTIQTGGRISQAYLDRYATSYSAWVRWLGEHAPGVRLIAPLQFAFKDNRGNPALTSTYSQALRLSEIVRLLVQRSQSCREPVLPLILMVSYNEHFEGSSVEPTLQYQYDWFDVLARVFGTPMSTRQGVAPFPGPIEDLPSPALNGAKCLCCSAR